MNSHFDHDLGTFETCTAAADAAAAAASFLRCSQSNSIPARCEHVGNKLYLCRKLSESLGI